MIVLAVRTSAFAPPSHPSRLDGPSLGSERRQSRRCRNVAGLGTSPLAPRNPSIHPTALLAGFGGDGDDNPSLSLIRSWLSSKLPSLPPSELEVYANSLLNDGYSTSEQLADLNSGSSGRVEDLYFMRKDHRRLLMRELGGGLRGRSGNSARNERHGGGEDMTDGSSNKGGNDAGRPTEFGSTEVDGEFALVEEFNKDEGSSYSTLGGDDRPARNDGPVVAVPVLLDEDNLDAARAKLNELIGSDAGGNTNEGRVDGSTPSGLHVDEEAKSEEAVPASEADVRPAEEVKEVVAEENQLEQAKAGGTGRQELERETTVVNEVVASDHPGPGDDRADNKRREAVSLSTDERCARPVMSFEVSLFDSFCCQRRGSCSIIPA